MSWAVYLASVRVGGALPVEFLHTGDNADGMECCRVTMLVPHVGDPPSVPNATRIPLRVAEGMIIPISITITLPEWSDTVAASEWVRKQVHFFYRHEADEQIRVGGDRLFAPYNEH